MLPPSPKSNQRPLWTCVCARALMCVCVHMWVYVRVCACAHMGAEHLPPSSPSQAEPLPLSYWPKTLFTQDTQEKWGFQPPRYVVTDICFRLNFVF